MSLYVWVSCEISELVLTVPWSRSKPASPTTDSPTLSITWEHRPQLSSHSNLLDILTSIWKDYIFIYGNLCLLYVNIRYRYYTKKGLTIHLKKFQYNMYMTRLKKQKWFFFLLTTTKKQHSVWIYAFKSWCRLSVYSVTQ